jgi:hypothetical protein
MSIIESAPAGRQAAAAVKQVLAGLGWLEELALWPLGSGELLALAEGLQRAATGVSAQALRAVAEVDSRGLAVDAGAPSTAAWLTGTVRMRPGLARRQVALARALAECPATAQALAEGQVSVEHAEVITRAMADLPASLDEPTMVQAETTLIEHAGQQIPSRLAKIGHHLLAVLDPDGPEPDDRDRPLPEPYLNVRTLVDGTCEGEFRLDAVTALTFTQLIETGAKPLPATEEGPDLRNGARRRADAFADLVLLAARTEHPRPGAGRPTIAVTIGLAELRAGLPVLGPDLQTIDPGTMRRLACDAKIIPVVLGTGSEVLDLGRAARTVSPGLRRALILRDGGCVNPQCRRPPDQCEAHHIVPWSEGGRTDLAGLVLVCGRDHDNVHHRGYSITVSDGRPVWTPPRWILRRE